MAEDAFEITLEDSERTRCEVWTRVMGYHRPLTAFNAGKQAEHRERKLFREAAIPDDKYLDEGSPTLKSLADDRVTPEPQGWKF